MFAEVILPVPLDGTFTYAIPSSLEGKVKRGCRVVVPFGKTKTHIGVVAEVTDSETFENSRKLSKTLENSREPSITIKPITQLLDETPVVTTAQLQQWQWLADYYLSPIGDVMTAALPAGLKSEGKYKPKTETYVRLNPRLMDERNLHIALDVLKRAPRQAEMFIKFLEISGIDNFETFEHPEIRTSENPEARKSGNPEIQELTRDELLNASHGNTNTLRQLIQRNFLEEYEKEVGRLNNLSLQPYKKINQLSEPQQEAYNKILLQFMQKNVVLLHGVTSSGKTEIYIHLIQRALERKEQVLYLMPEIALTIQMRQRLQSVFGNKLGVYHSKYSDEERVEIWQKQLSSDPYEVILGARSAVFLPFQRLGLVIIDEEHETSFKQQDPAPRYHARSAAIMLAHTHRMGTGNGCAKVLLGTATPSAESYYNTGGRTQGPPLQAEQSVGLQSEQTSSTVGAGQPPSSSPVSRGTEMPARQGKYGYVQLTTRFKGISLPEIKVIDLKNLRKRKMMYGPFSPDLLQAMKEAVANGEQVILFQNRRGFSQMLECHTCGWTPRCERCDVSLSFHKTTSLLTCHYCGKSYRIPDRCPACEGTDLRHRGIGTEKIEEQVMEYIPEAKIARMDLDTTRSRIAHERIINDFAAGRTNILIGTQMITKGLDFKNVSVVGIINADSLLNYPDFRAYEHAFTMLSQVAGRAGRHGKRGTVYLQTSQPQLPVMKQIVENDHTAFFRDLMLERRLYKYPPFYRVIYVFLKHKNPATASTAATEMASRLRQTLGQDRVLGPETPYVAVVKSLSIRRIMIKLETGISLQQVRQILRQAQTEMLANKRYNSLTMYFDVDPN